VFDLFSKKKHLSEVFPFDFVDIHSHLLPGIDDGAKDLEESIALIQKMDSYGIQNFITTPHVLGNVWPNSSDAILDQLELVQEALEKRDLSHIKIDAAAEYMLDEQFCELLKKRDLLTLKEDALLVELSYFNAPVNLFAILFDIQLAGYRPILAHPERYSFYHNNLDSYKKLKNAGCRFQLNLLSLTGYYGDSTKKTAEKLVQLDMIDFVGSDVHHHRHLEGLKSLGSKKTFEKISPLLKKNLSFL
jgi:tyrosine-protein phosphatase YwqE